MFFFFTLSKIVCHICSALVVRLAESIENGIYLHCTCITNGVFIVFRCVIVAASVCVYVGKQPKLNDLIYCRLCNIPCSCVLCYNNTFVLWFHDICTLYSYTAKAKQNNNCAIWNAQIKYTISNILKLSRRLNHWSWILSAE